MRLAAAMRLGPVHLQRAGAVVNAFDWQCLLRAYTSHVKPTDSVLEIGSSTTARTRQLAERCATLLGIEFYDSRLPDDFANVHYVRGDWERLLDVVPSASIDVAVSSHVIEHVKDDLRAINQLYEVLKPEGVALLTTPNRKRLVRSVIERVSGERKFPWWEHQREYVEDDIVRLVTASRFERFEIEPIGFGLQGGPLHVFADRPPGAMRRLANVWQIKLVR